MYVTQRLALLIFSVCSLLAVPARANDGQVVQTGSYPLDTTYWEKTATLNKFDGTLGTLESVELILDGEILANAGYENLSGTHNDISLRSAANIAGTFPNNPFLEQYGFQLTIMPANFGTFWNIPGFDGVNDFNNISGQMLTGLTGQDSETLSTAMAYTFHPVIRLLIHDEFTDSDGPAGGLETINMLIEASGASLANDVRGNVASIFQTSATGSFSLVYNYQNSITTGSTPEPRSIVPFLIGMFFVSFLRFGRK